MTGAGAKVVVGGESGRAAGYSFANTLLRVSAEQFIRRPEVFQTEAFGNVSLLVIAQNEPELAKIIDLLEGNLTGTVYSDTQGAG